MKLFSNRKLVVGATSLVLLAGAGGAFAATHTSGQARRAAYINDVAKRLNVAPATLTAAMQAAADDRVEAAVAAGRITAAQGDLLKQRISRHGGLGFLLPTLGGGRRGGLEQAAGRYLGLDRAAIRSQLQSGKTLAEIASSTPGKSTKGLKAALIAAAKARLDRAVSAGRITSAQEQKRLDRLTARVEALLQRTGVGAWRAGAGASR